MNVLNRDNKANSLQVSRLDNITLDSEGEFKNKSNFLIKNITISADGFPINISAQIIPAGQDEYIETVLFPGWNPEICKAIKIDENSLPCCGSEDTIPKLQYGW